MIRNLVIVVCSLALAAAGTEVLARRFFPEWAPRTGTAANFWRYDETYGWSNVPNTVGHFASYGFDAVVAHNAAGFRGPEMPPRADTAERRILVLGDSYVWGFGVSEDQIFTARMQRLCPKVKVINLGVSGYSTDQELLLFLDKGAAYAPDTVILVVATNDYEGNASPREYVYYYKPYFALESGRLILRNQPVPRMNFLLRRVANIARRSYVLTQLNRAIEGSRLALAERQHESWPVRASSAPLVGQGFSRDYAGRLTGLLMKEMFESVRAAGATFVVVFTDHHGPRATRLERFLASPHIGFVHLDNVFRHADEQATHLPRGLPLEPSGSRPRGRNSGPVSAEYPKAPGRKLCRV